MLKYAIGFALLGLIPIGAIIIDLSDWVQSEIANSNGIKEFLYPKLAWLGVVICMGIGVYLIRDLL